MAPSVEMASAPFGCVLRDHNRRDHCRESNARATMGSFQKNLKTLVRDHLHTCIAVDSNENNNSENQIDNGESRVRKEGENNNNSNEETGDGLALVMIPTHARVLDRWAFSKQMVSKPIERQRSQEAEIIPVPNSAPSSTRTSTSTKEGETMPRTESLAQISRNGSVGASSLVQIWEKRLSKSNSLKINGNGNITTEVSRSSSIDNDNDNALVPNARVSELVDISANVSSEKAGDSVLCNEKAGESVEEAYDTGPVAEDSFEDSSDGANDDARNLDAAEKEKVRVSDIIRRLKAQSCPSSSFREDNTNTNDNDPFSSAHGSPCRESLREPSRERSSGLDQEHGRFSQVISSPRIRGRQAFADLLMQLERDRHRELNNLVERKTVSRFPQRARTRIQSLLRLRLLQRGAAFAGTDVLRPRSKESKANKSKEGSGIMHLREKFSTGVDQGDAARPKSPHREIVKNISIRNSSTSNKPRADPSNSEDDTFEQKDTAPVARPSENNLPHVSEKDNLDPTVTLQEKSSVARSLDSQDTANTATPVKCLNENEKCKGKDSGVKTLDSRETADTTTSSNDCGGNEVRKGTSLESRKLDAQEIADTRSSIDGDGKTSSETRNLETKEIVDTRPCSDGDGKTSSDARILDTQEITETRDFSDGDGKTSSEIRILETQETADAASSMNSWNENAVWRGTNSEAGNLDLQENEETTTSWVDWDENDDDYQYYGETNNDWISEISRPRSYWEDIRKSWYQEMLHSNSEKGEIHQLLERRTVSNFLSSDFRDRIDRLMASRIERRQTHGDVSQGEDQDYSHEVMNQMMSLMQQRVRPAGIVEEVQEQVREHEQDQEEEEMTEEHENHNDDEDNEEEARSLISNKFHEASDYLECASTQPSPSQFTTWSYQDNEVDDSDRATSSPRQQSPFESYYPNSPQRSSSPDNDVDDSDRATSASPRQQSPFESYYPNSPQRSPSPCQQSPFGSQYLNTPQRSPSLSYHRQSSPSNNHHSVEMELIYDLRGNMMQLYQEMSELRKELKSCIAMQMRLQQSMKQDVHSGQVGKKRNHRESTKKGNCCICNEVKIDSLLYRCGHMCTCLKCAQELQWNNGNCPICQAPIVDVVKAYMDS